MGNGAVREAISFPSLICVKGGAMNTEECPDCGRMVSRNAKVCPHCGGKTRYARKVENDHLESLTVWIFIIIGFITFMAIVMRG